MKDFLIDDNGEMIIRNGDFHVAQSDEQNIKYILKFTPGQSKQNPKVGCGIQGLKLGFLSEKIKANIQSQIKADGYTITKLELDKDNNLIINVD